MAAPPAPVAALPVRRNTALLAAALAANSAMLQLSAAVASLTLVLVLDVRGLLGLGPAIVLASGALAALPAGRAMDRIGRVPVIAYGFFVTAIGSALTALGAAQEAWFAVVPGFALIGIGAGSVTLSRTAAGDMYPPERRAQGIAWVLFGSVFGAILGPFVFSPIFAGRELDAEALVAPWLVSSLIALVGVGVVLCVRPDPKRIAELIAPPRPENVPEPASAPLREIVARPGVETTTWPSRALAPAAAATTTTAPASPTA